MRYFMGIDIGTYESKGVLMDKNGKCIMTHSVAHEMTSPLPGYAEHDAEKVWWGELCIISNVLLEKSGINSNEILGLGCSAIGPCCLPVDENCNPLRQGILYGVDVRAEKQIRLLNDALGEDFILEKYGSPITSQSIAPKILWIKENEPDIYKRTARFLTSTSYMVAKLTGNYVIDRYTAAALPPMYNMTTNDWDYDNLEMFCKPEQLAECRWTDEVAGYITKEAAAATGLKEGTPVTTGTPDASADAVGVGVFNPGDMLLMFGSSNFIIHVTPKPISDKRYWSGPYLFENTYTIASGMATAGTLTRWFRDRLLPDLLSEQELGKGNAYELILKELKDIPPGSDGLICLPYFSGERTPINDPLARGVFFGLTLHHTRAHMYQSCLEGVGYGIAQHFDGYAEIGMETKKIVAVGGGTKNEKWMQIISDVSGKELLVGDEFGAAYGDAILAALATGALSSPNEASKFIKFRKTVYPNPDNYKVYRPYLEVYTELYNKTKDLMHRLA